MCIIWSVRKTTWMIPMITMNKVTSQSQVFWLIEILIIFICAHLKADVTAICLSCFLSHTSYLDFLSLFLKLLVMCCHKMLSVSSWNNQSNVNKIEKKEITPWQTNEESRVIIHFCCTSGSALINTSRSFYKKEFHSILLTFNCVMTLLLKVDFATCSSELVWWLEEKVIFQPKHIFFKMKNLT